MRVRILEPAVRSHVNRVAGTGFGEIGKTGRARGTRELVHGRYVITYRLDEIAGEILVMSVIHGARRP